jgi:hypothetical protein
VRLDSVCRGTRHARTDRNANTRPTSLGWGLPVIVPESGSWGTNDVASGSAVRVDLSRRRSGAAGTHAGIPMQPQCFAELQRTDQSSELSRASFHQPFGQMNRHHSRRRSACERQCRAGSTFTLRAFLMASASSVRLTATDGFPVLRAAMSCDADFPLAAW